MLGCEKKPKKEGCHLCNNLLTKNYKLGFMEILRKEFFSEFQKKINALELNHTLDSSEIMIKYLKILSTITNHQKATLSYFLPLTKWMQDDLVLIARCFEKVLQLPENSINITVKKQCRKNINGSSNNQWKLNVNMVIGGVKQCMTPSYEVQIKLRDATLVETYLEGGAKRKLLESILYPRFLGEKKEYHTQLIVATANKHFKVSKEKAFARIGINTCL